MFSAELKNINFQLKINELMKTKIDNTENEALNKTDVLVAQLKYTKNLYKNWIFRKFKYARKEEFYAPIICFG